MHDRRTFDTHLEQVTEGSLLSGGVTYAEQYVVFNKLAMAKSCPACNAKVSVPLMAILEGAHVDFDCPSCGAELRLEQRLVMILALMSSLPCVFWGYRHYPVFTILIGDLLVVGAFLLLFSPLRNLSLRKKSGANI